VEGILSAEINSLVDAETDGFCESGRRQRDRKPDKKQDIPFIPGLDPISRSNGGKQPPIYNPPGRHRVRVASTDEMGDAQLDRSGHGDLGLGLVRHASNEGLDEIGQGGAPQRGAPKQDSVPNRSDHVIFLDLGTGPQRLLVVIRYSKY